MWLKNPKIKIKHCSKNVYMLCLAWFGTVCTILKNVKNNHGGASLLLKYHSSMGVFSHFCKMCKWYQFVQSVSYKYFFSLSKGYRTGEDSQKYLKQRFFVIAWLTATIGFKLISSKTIFSTNFSFFNPSSAHFGSKSLKKYW